MLFSELSLKPELLNAVQELGFTQPTPVQEESIPLLIKKDRDLIGLAQTGTGKTAAFGLPMIHRIDIKKKIVQGLVIAPTRELCVQISNDFKYSLFSNKPTAKLYFASLYFLSLFNASRAYSIHF